MIRKCILYPSHVDILLLQYHDIISARRVLWGEKIAWRVWRRINKGQLSSLLSEYRGNVSALNLVSERASKTRDLKPRTPRHALGIETRDGNGHFFDQQKFWRWRLPLYSIPFIIFVTRRTRTRTSRLSQSRSLGFLVWCGRTFSAKTLPFGAAHTYTAYIRECPPRT